MSFIPTNIALAAESGAQKAANYAQPSLIEQLVPFFLLFIVMYFLILRPQIKKTKEHQTLIKSLKPGDEVVTTGGIIGRVKSVAEEFISIDVGSTTLKIVKEHVASFTKAQKTTSSKS